MRWIDIANKLWTQYNKMHRKHPWSDTLINRAENIDAYLPAVYARSL